jgi:glycerol-3-phosphate acyltransferase PlsY
VNPALLILISYVMGATPTSYWVGRGFYGVDLREVGSGNLGATNTFRALGWKAALPVVVVDILKGYLPVVLFPGLDGNPEWAWALAYGSAAIIGHVFSFWVRFKGGKGVATSAGVFIAIAPASFGIALLAFAGVVSFTRIVSLGSITAALVVPVSVYFLPHAGGTEVFWFSILLSAFVIWAHRSNIGRLMRGEENRFGSGKKTPTNEAEREPR